ncbi:hypothetical protein CCM_02015 [Cordyceps militaris CM01]|uniref:Rhodopsin domain-containing protein n=1 Tax=Cordyceps militaris (strain CM01) TaxID=983644 RepID=G3JC28_CORMM|nr:uncharacterized protein CCM_02015 [Cordyceps militaris CM01]EGX93746.1 hypothetical protein CCM_02015 [Cordyceps militaris CM01]
MAEIHGVWLASATGIFFGWAFLAWILRVWAKLRTKSWMLDDYTLSGSLLAAFLHLVSMCHAIRYGYGKTLDMLPAANMLQVDMGLYLGQIFYIISVGLCRVAAALFVAYISHSGPHIRPARIVAGITAFWTGASTLAICVRGEVSHPWTTITGPDTFGRWLVIEVTGILLELGLWGVAAHLIWSIRLKRSKRVLVVCAFGARLLYAAVARKYYSCANPILRVIPFIIARLVFLDPRIKTGPANSATIADLFTAACLYLSIIAGAATALKPLLTSFYAEQPVVVNCTASSSGLGSKNRSESVSPLATVEPAVLRDHNKKTSRPVVINRTAVSAILWQPPSGPSRGYDKSNQSGGSSGSLHSAASSWTRNSSRADRKKRDATVTGSSLGMGRRERGPSVSVSAEEGRLVIQKTTEVTVHYK